MVKKIIFFILCISLNNALAAGPAVADLIKSFLPGAKIQNDKFKVNKCPPYNQQWTTFFLLGQEFVGKYKFASGCDIQGEIPYKYSAPFPMELQLQNFGNFNRVKMTTTIKLDLQTMVLQISVDKGQLIGKQTEYFTGNYQVKVSMNQGKLVYSDDSGNIDFYQSDKYKKKTHSMPVKMN